MKFVQQLSLYVGFTSVAFLLIGLYKPWVMLWWEDVQNRKKVIKLYGTVAGLCGLLYYGMNFFIQS